MFSKAIDLLKETFTNLGPRLLSQQVEINEDFIGSCRDYIKEKGGGKVGDRSRMEVEALRLCRVCVLRPLRVRSGVPGEEERSCIPLFPQMTRPGSGDKPGPAPMGDQRRVHPHQNAGRSSCTWRSPPDTWRTTWTRWCGTGSSGDPR